MKVFRLSIYAIIFAFACQKPEEVKRPNILFAIADDASYPHMSAYGTKWVRTPAFDYVAQNGLLFNRAYTTNAKCAPSRATILTGRNSWQLEEACNHWPRFPEKFKTFPEAMSEADYFVGHTAKGWAPGIAEKNGIKRNLIGPAFNEHQLEPPARFISSNDYSKNFASFLDQVPEGKPWFFWYGAIEPHRAYEYGVGARLGGKSVEDIDHVPPYWPDTDSVRMDMLDYAYEIEYFDSHLQKMLDLLREKDLLDQTLIVVTADNGMPFPRVKGQVYERDNHLPLAIMWPEGIADPGRSIEDFVSFSDFAPTFLEVAGIDGQISGMQEISGYSILDLFANQPNKNIVRDHILVGKERHDIGRPNDVGYPVRGIIKDGYMFTINFKPDRWPAGNPETGYLNCDGSPTKTVILDLPRDRDQEIFWQMSFGKRPAEELYQISEDPYCINNLAMNADHQKRKEELKAQLLRELEQQGDPRVLGNGDVFDQYQYADTKTANFYNRWQQGDSLRAGWVNPSDFENVREVAQ